MISTGHELEISSWGMDPISNQGGGEEISRLFLVAQTAFEGGGLGVVKSSYPEKIRLFKNEIKVVGFEGFFFFTLQTCKFGGFYSAVRAAERGCMLRVVCSDNTRRAALQELSDLMD